MRCSFSAIGNKLVDINFADNAMWPVAIMSVIVPSKGNWTGWIAGWLDVYSQQLCSTGPNIYGKVICCEPWTVAHASMMQGVSIHPLPLLQRNLSHFLAKWDVALCATCKTDPKFCLAGCCCAWCIACYQRELMLYDKMNEEYLCCQGTFGTKCCCPNQVKKCPHCCLCLEVCCCLGCSIKGIASLGKYGYSIRSYNKFGNQEIEN